MIVVYHRCADAQTMAEYARLALPALIAFGGRFPVRASGDTVTAREAGLCERVVVVEFPSKQVALEAYDSAAYQQAFALIAKLVERDVRFVEGQPFVPGS